MSAIGPVDHFDVSPEKAYFRQLEGFVIELCGAPHQLSPDDWKVSREWHRADIPLTVVEAAMRSVVQRRQAEDQEVPRRLSFYRRAVASAWKETSNLTITAERQAAPSLDVAGRLTRLRTAVLALGAEWAEVVAEQLADLISEGGELNAEEVERQLVELDALLLQAAEENLDDNRRQTIESGVDAVLRPLAARLPPEEAAQARQRLWQERVRRTMELPVLSLFSLAAADVGASGVGSS